MKNLLLLILFLVTVIMLLFFIPEIIIAQAPPPPSETIEQAPIDGGLGLLAAAGGAYAIKKMRVKKRD